MATEITVNTSKTHLSLAIDRTDYPSNEYLDFDDIPVSHLGIEKGSGVSSILKIRNAANGNIYQLSTSNGVINVNAVAATDNADLRSKILAAL